MIKKLVDTNVITESTIDKHSVIYTPKMLGQNENGGNANFHVNEFKKYGKYLWKKKYGLCVDSTFSILIGEILINNILKLTKSIFLVRRKCFLFLIRGKEVSQPFL